MIVPREKYITRSFTRQQHISRTPPNQCPLFLLSYCASYAWAEYITLYQYYIPTSREEECKLRRAMNDGYGLWMADGHGYEDDEDLKVIIEEVTDEALKTQLIPIIDTLQQSKIRQSSEFGTCAWKSRE